MQQSMKKIYHMPFRYAFLFGLIILGGLSIYFSFKINDPDWRTLVGGIGGGIIVYILSFLFSIYEYIQIDKYRSLGIRNILKNRRDKSYYANVIKDAKEQIQVMGASCSSFINDFADIDSDEHILIDALKANPRLNVKFLIPTEDKMDLESRNKFAGHKVKIDALLRVYKNRVELKRYDFDPRHSLVRVDSSMIVGPIFQGVESRNAPAIHVDVPSIFSERYVSYFDNTWNSSKTYS